MGLSSPPLRLPTTADGSRLSSAWQPSGFLAPSCFLAGSGARGQSQGALTGGCSGKPGPPRDLSRPGDPCSRGGRAESPLTRRPYVACPGHLPFGCHFVPFISGPHSLQSCIAAPHSWEFLFLFGIRFPLHISASCLLRAPQLGGRCPCARAPR